MRDQGAGSSAEKKYLPTGRLKELAIAQGFDDCRVATVEREADDGFDAWLRAGCHGEMGWLARTRKLRQSTTLKLPGARSIIVLAKNYYRSDLEPAPGMARIARYAWHSDYHRAFARPLRSLTAAILEHWPDAICYASTDSGPVRERAWAARAGIGWIGRNGLVIHPQYGSWILLATVITTAPFAPDPPLSDRCGNCRACVEACPTHAILEGRVSDARKCISYHTVENKGNLPPFIAAALRGRVFGCDACQECCPWNRRRDLPESDWRPRESFRTLSAAALADMTPEHFPAMFSGTPVMRAGLAVIRRNASAALPGGVPDVDGTEV